MGYSVALPQTLPGEEMVRFARRAEELGFDGLWTMDAAIGGRTGHNPAIDGLYALGHVSPVTESVRLGMAVIVLPRRNPLMLARELASLDRLSGGRLTVGVGLGPGRPEEAAPLGFAADRPVRRLTEGVAVMRAAWTQPLATFDGELYRFADVPVEPKPVQRPHPPLWFGARVESALRRAARLGDGWIGAGSTSSDDFVAHARLMREALESAGRDPASFPMAKRVYVAIDDSEARGRESLARVLDPMYRDPGLTERVAVCGPPERVREELARLGDAGARELLLHPLLDQHGQLEALAEVAAA
jgi:probable F420-dependent oxidoreductase